MYILKEYEKDGFKFTEYTFDNENISHVTKELIQTEPIEPSEPEPTLKEIQETQMAIMSGIFDVYLAQLNK